MQDRKIVNNFPPFPSNLFEKTGLSYERSFTTPMSEKYKMRDKDKAYFVTLTVVDWQFAFHQANDKKIIVESLIYCQQYKGLEIYAWCLMSNHLHMIVRATGEQALSEILAGWEPPNYDF